MASAFPVRVLIVEDDEAFLRVVEAVLSPEPWIEVAGFAHEGREALALISSVEPLDVVITNLEMPVMGGLELTRRLARERPDIEVVILTARESPGDDVEAHQAGAAAYVRKSLIHDDLVRVLRALAGSDV